MCVSDEIRCALQLNMTKRLWEACAASLLLVNSKLKLKFILKSIQSRNRHDFTHTPRPYLVCGTSILEETTLRFCSSKDTDRVSGSRLTRLPSTGRCSSAASGFRQPLSFWPSTAPLLELSCGSVERTMGK